MTYDDLSRISDFFDRICGTAGAAGNLRGEIREGGNPFERPAQRRPYPTAAMKASPPLQRFPRRRRGNGPCIRSRMPSANVTEPY